MYLVLGDWSDDGHGKYDKVLLLSNKSVEEIQNAYKASCKLTGLQFNINEDYTGRNLGYQEAGKYQIACEYEGSTPSEEAVEILKSFNVPMDVFEEYDEEDDEKDYCLHQDSFVKLWVWFVKLSLPDDTVLEQSKDVDQIPNINGFWDKNLNQQFGYGLYW